MWMYKPMRLLQLLWEKRFMCTSKYKCTYYTLCGLEDNYGNKILETSLRKLMRNRLNFIDEETLLQTNDLNIREHIYHIVFNHNSKFHLNIFVQGIEYSWGKANYYYRQLSLDKINGKTIIKISGC